MAAAWQLPQLLCLLLAASWATSGAAQDPAWAFSCPTGACSKQQVASQTQADPVLRDLSLQRSGNIANSPVEGIVLQQFAVWAASVGYVGPIDPNSPQFANFVLNMRQVRQVRLWKELGKNLGKNLGKSLGSSTKGSGRAWGQVSLHTTSALDARLRAESFLSFFPAEGSAVP